MPVRSPWSAEGVDASEPASYDRPLLDAPLPVTDGQPVYLPCHRHAPDLSRFGERLPHGRVEATVDRVAPDPASSMRTPNATAPGRVEFIRKGTKRTRDPLGERTP
mgnify:FL=1